MNLLERAKRRWQEYTGEEETPLDGDTPAWFISLLIHMAVLVSLAAAGLAMPRRTANPITIIQPSEAIDDEVLLAPQEIAFSPDVPAAVGAESEQGMEVAAALAPTLAEQSVVPVVADDAVVNDVDFQALDVVPTGLQFDADIVVKGAVGVGTTGAAGAVDRLTAEIANSLEQRPTVVCWLFDQSVSLAGQRADIAARLGRVFDELGANRSDRNRPDLTNIVIAFGKDASVVTKTPTHDVREVVGAIQSIAVDDSGVELTFGAIRRAAEAARVFRTKSPRKNVMIIAFTDEVGNDQKEADQTAAVCRTLGIPVYVVGVPAPFGMREVKMKYVDPDPRYDQDVQWALIEQGPETLYPEVVRVRSGRFADEAIDSGFGPFSLSKLCGETGGIYFCVHANRNATGRVGNEQTAAMSSQLRYFFDQEAMRPYQPDYVSAAKVDQMLMANRAKRALVEAARNSEISPMESPETIFPREDDGALVLLLGEAQKAAAKLQPKIDALLV
ncbi:MAG: VWA domain-containing protein, partial [Planctomycetia bacterium]|nr:VWA domain-containing protein [Planctomycetia bacterium]